MNSPTIITSHQNVLWFVHSMYAVTAHVTDDERAASAKAINSVLMRLDHAI